MSQSLEMVLQELQIYKNSNTLSPIPTRKTNNTKEIKIKIASLLKFIKQTSQLLKGMKCSMNKRCLLRS